MSFLCNIRLACYHWPTYSKKNYTNLMRFNRRTLNTSKKANEITPVHTETPPTESNADIKPVQRHWQSYGFDYHDEKTDYMKMQTSFFSLFFIILGGGTFLLYYYPDMADDDWYTREAYIQLRRREVLGLPLVDPNYVDPKTINLPPDEELGDDDIII